MTIRHLKIFLAVAEYKTMSAAAEKLYISQPTVRQSGNWKNIIMDCFLKDWGKNYI